MRNHLGDLKSLVKPEGQAERDKDEVRNERQCVYTSLRERFSRVSTSSR